MIPSPMVGYVSPSWDDSLRIALGCFGWAFSAHQIIGGEKFKTFAVFLVDGRKPTSQKFWSFDSPIPDFFVFFALFSELFITIPLFTIFALQTIVSRLSTVNRITLGDASTSTPASVQKWSSLLNKRTFLSTLTPRLRIYCYSVWAGLKYFLCFFLVINFFKVSPYCTSNK